MADAGLGKEKKKKQSEVFFERMECLLGASASSCTNTEHEGRGQKARTEAPFLHGGHELRHGARKKHELRHHFCTEGARKKHELRHHFCTKDACKKLDLGPLERGTGQKNLAKVAVHFWCLCLSFLYKIN